MWWMLLASALGADWLTLQGSEFGREDTAIRAFGFVQPQVDAFIGGDLVNGQRPAFNAVSGSVASVRVRRARVGVRGSIPKTDQRVSYYLLAEAGEVSLTRDAHVVISDASLTLSAPGARLRLGQFKLPVMEEIVQGVAVSLEFIHLSNTLTGLLLENRVAETGQYTGPSFGFRDVGVQLFDGFQTNTFAGSYAVMLSNGNGIHAGDIDSAKDLSVRGEVAWVFGTTHNDETEPAPDSQRESPRRRELKVGGWWLEGTRPVDDERARRARRGLFVHLEQGSYWGLVELADGTGMLESGRTTPFASGDVVISPAGRGWGAVAQAGGRATFPVGTVGLKARFDRYHRRTDSAAALRIFQTTTLGVEYDPVRRVRIQVNYEFRDLRAPNGEAPAQQVADAMADRLTAQVTASF